MWPLRSACNTKRQHTQFTWANSKLNGNGRKRISSKVTLLRIVHKEGRLHRHNISILVLILSRYEYLYQISRKYVHMKQMRYKLGLQTHMTANSISCRQSNQINWHHCKFTWLKYNIKVKIRNEVTLGISMRPLKYTFSNVDKNTRYYVNPIILLKSKSVQNLLRI